MRTGNAESTSWPVMVMAALLCVAGMYALYTIYLQVSDSMVEVRIATPEETRKTFEDADARSREMYRQDMEAKSKKVAEPKPAPLPPVDM